MTLAQYIVELVARLQLCDPQAYDRLCQVVGGRTARIQLDDQCAYVRVRDGIVDVATEAPESATLDGEGATDRATVLALLRGDLEVSEAILNGSLLVHGDIAAINRMFQAIEILLDASPRCPPLQLLSEQFTAETTPSPAVSSNLPRASWYPFVVSSDEIEFLSRYGLLPP